jgi:hypothetical protein
LKSKATEFFACMMKYGGASCDGIFFACAHATIITYRPVGEKLDFSGFYTVRSVH